MNVPPNGNYRITNKQHSLRLDANEKAVYGAPANKGQHQIWTLTAVSDAVYTVISTATEKALDGNGSGAVYPLPPNGGKHQQWRFVEDSGFHRITNEATNLRLQCDWGDSPTGDITLKERSEADTQRWVIEKV